MEFTPSKQALEAAMDKWRLKDMTRRLNKARHALFKARPRLCGRLFLADLDGTGTKTWLPVKW